MSTHESKVYLKTHIFYLEMHLQLVISQKVQHITKEVRTHTLT
jgi:hypothetical protein